MRPVRIEGYTREMAKGQDEYLNLCIKDELVDVPGVGVVPSMLSCWEPTPQQLAALNRGGKVFLRILGSSLPPVSLTVRDFGTTGDIL